MLDSLYTTLFRPAEAPKAPPMPVAWGIWLLVSLTEAMHLAGTLSLGAGGLTIAFMAFFAFNVVGWFWLSSASHLLAQVMGGKGAAESTLTAIAQAFWPLILLPSLTAAEPWLSFLAPLLTFAVFVWVYWGVARAIAQAHALTMGRAVLILLLSGSAAGLGALAMAVMPILGIVSALAW